MSENPQILLKFHAESFYMEAAMLLLKPHWNQLICTRWNHKRAAYMIIELVYTYLHHPIVGLPVNAGVSIDNEDSFCLLHFSVIFCAELCEIQFFIFTKFRGIYRLSQFVWESYSEQVVFWYSCKSKSSSLAIELILPFRYLSLKCQNCVLVHVKPPSVTFCLPENSVGFCCSCHILFLFSQQCLIWDVNTRICIMMWYKYVTVHRHNVNIRKVVLIDVHNDHDYSCKQNL